MNDKKPTSSFALPRAKKEAWVAALRSGTYPQGSNYLYIEDADGRGGYCCLGVLCHISGIDNDTMMAEQWPDLFMKIDFTQDSVEHFAKMYQYGLHPENEDPLYLSILNDEHRMPFPKIADLIEKYLETTD